MALPDSLKLTVGTIIVVSDTTDYAGDLGTRTHQIDLTGVATLEARESDQIDFGANRDLECTMFAALEFATAPVLGEVVKFYIAWSPSATAATANPGGVTGSDADYAGYSSNLVEAVKQLDFIGDIVCTVQIATTVQFAVVGSFIPLMRYGTLVVYNATSDDFHSDANEMAVLIQPRTLQVQD